MTDRAGACAVFTGASVWGLFWIPLRYLDTLGISSLWALTLVMAAAVVPAGVLAAKQGELGELAIREIWKAGLALGLATTLYFIALVYTDVIRAIFLFYLLPMWTALSARLIYGEPLGAGRILIILVALAGLWMLLGGGNKLPIPESLGDWCAIASGFCWGVSLSLLRGKMQGGAFSRSLIAVGSAFVFSLMAAFVLDMTSNAMTLTHTGATTDNTLPIQWVVVLLIATGFGTLALYPAMLAQIWGAQRIPAPTAALLTMSEIVVAVLSAAVLIGTDLPPLALLGGGIIVTALCLDIALQIASHRGSDAPPAEILPGYRSTR